MEIVRPSQGDIVSLTFASGEAYDFLISLYVLMRPEKYQLSAGWARSVRTRLSAENRKILRFFFGPEDAPGPGILHLVPEIEAPYSAEAMVEYVTQMGPDRFVGELLTKGRPGRAPAAKALEEMASGRPFAASLDAPLQEFMRGLTAQARHRAQRLVASSAEFHAAYVALLDEYRRLHFETDWEQTSKTVTARLRQDQAMVGRLQPREVIARVTGGVTLAPEDRQHVILVPAYYASPFVWIVHRPRDVLLLYGARRKDEIDASEAPAIDPVLAASLKALADESRLRMLRLLSTEPMYGQQLAQRLGLSHATVSHHMALLRSAGFTRTELSAASKRYSLRKEGLEILFDELLGLLGEERTKHVEVNR